MKIQKSNMSESLGLGNFVVNDRDFSATEF